jgi:hypothetical protein
MVQDPKTHIEPSIFVEALLSVESLEPSEQPASKKALNAIAKTWEILRMQSSSLESRQ